KTLIATLTPPLRAELTPTPLAHWPTLRSANYGSTTRQAREDGSAKDPATSHESDISDASMTNRGKLVPGSKQHHSHSGGFGRKWRGHHQQDMDGDFECVNVPDGGLESGYPSINGVVNNTSTSRKPTCGPTKYKPGLMSQILVIRWLVQVHRRVEKLATSLVNYIAQEIDIKHGLHMHKKFFHTIEYDWDR
ncbi:hypothetical protein L211DRAFT_339505, partial [Terfezia boudieri ATCC MYA-4762]